MNEANGSGIHQSSLPLKEWSELLSHYEQEQIRQASVNKNDETNDNPGHDYFNVKKLARRHRVVTSACIAAVLVDRLVLVNQGGDTEGDDSDVEGSSIILQPKDLSIENFAVKITTIGNDQNSLGSGALSAREIIKHYSMEQIKDALGSVKEVDFVSSDLQQKRRISFDERLQDAYFQKLGLLLYRLFLPEAYDSHSLVSVEFSSMRDGDPSGENDQTEDSIKSNDEEEAKAKRGRGKHTVHENRKNFKQTNISEIERRIQEHLLPMSICRLIADLIQAGMHDCSSFETINDVSLELKQIIGDPQRFIHDEDNAQSSLFFPEDMIFGRNSEISALVNSFVTAQLESTLFINSVVLVSGPSGSGKSKLLQNVTGPMARNGWLVLECKFDRTKQNQSTSTVAAAFDNYFHSLAALRSQLEDGLRGELAADLYAIISAIEAHLSPAGIATLSDIIPSLRLLFPDIFRSVVEDDDDCSSMRNSNDDTEEDCLVADTFKHRKQYLFKRLVRALSTPERPAMIVLDDLQWSATAELDLVLSSFVTNSRQFQLMDDGDGEEDNPHCFVVAGTYRSDEVDEDHVLSSYLQEFEASEAHVTIINLEGLEAGGTHAMISHALGLPLRLTRELAQVLQNKCLGIPLLIKSLLNSLQVDSVLQYSLERKRWTWDIDAVRARSIDDDIAAIVARKLEGMPKDVQWALSVASCFGAKVDDEVLRLLSGSHQFKDVLRILERVKDDGIIEKVGTQFVFPHDVIRQNVYDQIDYSEVDDLHYSIGTQLLNAAGMNKLSKIAIIGLDQCNAATSVQITDPCMRTLLASMNCRVSDRLIETAQSSVAIFYCEHGLRMLKPDDWQQNFDVCLKLHESACLASFVNGNSCSVSSYAEEVMSHTTDLMHRVKTLFIVIRSLGTSGHPELAVEKAFFLLSQLGEDFPDDVGVADLVSALATTKELLFNYSKEQIRDAPVLNDEKKRWALKLMVMLGPYVFQVCPMRLPLCGCRMIEISITHGFCRESAFGFTNYGHSCISILGDIKEGYRWAKESFTILERFNGASILPKFQCLVYGYLAFWVEPIQSTAMTLAQCYHDSFMMGDVEYAFIGSTLSAMQHFLCGTVLSALEKDLDAKVSDMVQRNQIYNVYSQVCMQSAVFALSGNTSNPFDMAILLVTDEDEVISKFSSSRPILVQEVYFNRMFVSVFFRNFEAVAEITEKHLALGEVKSRLHDIFVLFFRGLAAFHLSRSKRLDTKWFSIGEEVVRQFQSWVEHSLWNFENKLLLLEAELHLSKGELNCAEIKYKDAIASARRHRFVHEEGLSRELLAAFYNKQGRVEEELENMEIAVSCYAKWGAYGLLKEARFNNFV